MSYGTGPFGTFGAGLPISASVADRGTVVSSRAIDMQGRLVQSGDDAGSFAGMTDVQQRVLILCALAGRDPIKQTNNLEAAIKTSLRAALAPLCTGTGAVIKLVDVVVERRDNGVTKIVKYVDLTNGESYEAEV